MPFKKKESGGRFRFEGAGVGGSRRKMEREGREEEEGMNMAFQSPQ